MYFLSAKICQHLRHLREIHNIMKTTHFLSFFLLLLASISLRATHIVGGDLYYDCASSTIYYTEYADCSGIPSGATADVVIEPLGACAGTNIYVTLNQMNSEEVTPICPGITTQCNAGAAYGVRATYYSAVVNVALSPTCKARIYKSTCCRSASITNLVNAGSSDFFIVTDSIAINGNCNSTPYFLNKPVIALCAGQSMTYSQAATDADGDSLVYTLGDNLGFNGAAIGYNGGYSLASPLGAGWNVSINAATGQLSFDAIGAGAIGTFALAIYVNEYRNGLYIGHTIRDMQVIVNNCGGGSAYNCCHVDYNYTLGGNVANFTAITAAGGIVASYDWDFNDGTPNGTTANPTHIYNIAANYQVKLKVVYTSGCSDSAIYKITFSPPLISANFSAIQSSPMVFDFTDLSTSANTITTWAWDFGDGTLSSLQNPQHVYNVPGLFNVCLTVTDNTSATNTFCQNVFGNLGPDASFFATPISPDSIMFTGTGISGTPPYSYSWQVIPFINGGIINPYIGNPIIVFPSSGTYIVCFYIQDATGFTDTACQSIIINIPPSCDPLFSFTTNNMSADFTPTNFNTNAIYTINYGDGSAPSSIGPVGSPPIFSHTYANNGVYTACMNATNGACSQDTCFNIGINIGVDIDGYIYSAPAGGTPDSFIVYLIEYTNTGGGTLTKIDSQYVAGNPAYYSFLNVNSNTLIFHTKAAMTLNSPNYATYIPTYYDSALLWINSTPICIPCVPPLPATFDIYMQMGINPGGQGFIGGLISQGANKTGEPAEEIVVILFDINDNPVTYTYTNNLGVFGINNLAYGTYKVYPEVVGLATQPYFVTIDGTNPSYNGVDMTMGDSLIAPTVVGIEMPSLPAAIVYPNPVSEMLTFQTDFLHSGIIHIEMFNIMGQKVYEFSEIAHSGKYEHEIACESLAAGIYTLKIVAENNGIQNIKVIVNH